MTAAAVAYSHDISCSSCGLKFSGYLEVQAVGNGTIVCPRCGANIIAKLPPHFIAQIPPADFESAAHPHVHHVHYPGLYTEPKHSLRFDFADLLRIAYSPRKAFMNLYLSTDLQRAMAIVLVFSMGLVAVSTLVTVDMADVIGYDARDALELGARAFLAWALSILTFMVFSMVSAAISKGVFGGRGERQATITLIGYCFPAYVLVTIILLAIFRVGIGSVAPIQDWTFSELNQVTAGVALVVIAAIIGVLWLLVVTSRAISVSNDISLGEGGLTAILSASAAGVIYLVVNMVVSLPLGLSF